MGLTTPPQPTARPLRPPVCGMPERQRTHLEADAASGSAPSAQDVTHSSRAEAGSPHSVRLPPPACDIPPGQAHAPGSRHCFQECAHRR